jgi:prepilin-type N-terminal cleavage/methylation domain-containing protein
MRGFSLLEVLLAVAIGATLVAMAVPVTTGAIDEIRTAGAARQVAAAIGAARFEAVRRGRAVALRFESDGDDYRVSPYADGNGNGVRTAEILTGVDRRIGQVFRLGDHYANVVFGLQPDIADLDDDSGTTDGVRIGATRLLSLSPTGGATSGTLYIHGRRSQYAVRVLGATGRVRVFQYDPGARRWNSR